MSVLPDGDWPPSIGRHYTRLALVENPRELLPDAEFSSTMERDYLHGKVDKIVGRKKEIQFPEIFTENPSETQLKILMDGAPGVGKTTLTRKMVCDWARGVLLEQFHLVILLHLRDPRVHEAKSINKFFPNDGPQFQQDIIQQIKDTAGEHVLFIFDAYDELSYEERTCNSLFLDIIEGSSLHNCSVLVTSRPYASDHLQQLNRINRHVEVLGFTKEQVESCIKLAIPDEEKATSLVNLLQERMDIISLCYIPLNCAIMLFVYKQEKYTLPDTLTELYEAFILKSLKQNAKNLTPVEKRLLNSATSLHGISKSVIKPLNILSKVALEGLSEDKMVFSFSAFSGYVHVDANMEDNFLGLMTGFSRTICTDYQFIHLSVQEFLAARWAAAQLVLLSDAEQVAYFQHHMKEDRFRLMLLFLAGISKLNFQHAHQIISGPIDLHSSIYRDFIPPDKVHFFFFILQLVFETKKLSLYQTLMIKSAITDHAINLGSYKLTAFDCVLLGHFLHWSNCSWKVLNLCGCGLTDHSLEILHKVSLSQPSSTTCIEEVDLSHCSFSTLPQITWFENTSKLTVKGATVVDDVIHSIGFMKHLHELCLSTKEDFSIGSNKTTLLLAHGNLKVCIFSHMYILNIPLNMNYLVNLDLSRNRMLFQNCSKCSVTRESALGALHHLLKTSNRLSKLGLSDCGLSDNDIEHITVGLADSVSLQKLSLDISENKLSGRAIKNLLTMAGVLTKLNLSHCGLSDNDIEDIIPGLAESSHIEQLNISENQLSAQGIIVILNSNNTLSHIDIGNQFENRNGTGGVAITSTRTGREIQKTIDFMNLNEVTVEGCKYTFKIIQRTSAIFKLRATYFTTGLTSNVVVGIFKLLEYNTNVVAVDLSYCWQPDPELTKIDSEAVGQALERMLRMNTGIRTLKLNSYKISDDIAKNIGLGLAGNKSLRMLDIAHNDIHSDGAVSIFTSLEHNSSLEELHLSSNSLTVGDSEAVGWALEKMLTVNCTLKVLCLQDCDLNDVVLYHLATGLTHTFCITELDISSNDKLHTESWVHLFKALCHNSSLKKLGISGNKLGLQGTEALAEMLAYNKSLNELKVKWYYSDLYGPPNVLLAELEVLARGLLNNTTLQRLVVYSSDVKEFLEAKINITEGYRLHHLTII